MEQLKLTAAEQLKFKEDLLFITGGQTITNIMVTKFLDSIDSILKSRTIVKAEVKRLKPEDTGDIPGFVLVG